MNQFLVTSTGQVLQLGEKVAGFLSILSTTVQVDDLAASLAASITSLADNARGKLPALIRDQLPADLTEAQVLEFLEMVRDQVAGLVDDIDTQRNKLEAEVRTYLQTINDLPSDGACWGWSIAEDAPLSPAGNLTLTLGGAAKISSSIHKPGPTYVLAGTLGISGSARVPFSFGAVGLSASSHGSVVVKAMFSHAGDTRLLIAAAQDLAVLGALNSPADLANAAHFSTAELTLSGAVKLGLSLQAGKSLVRSVEFGGKSATAALGLAATLDVGWSRQGTYILRVSRTDAGALAVTLEDQQLTASSRSLSLGAALDVSNLDDVVGPVLDRLAAWPDPVQALVDEYAKPSELLRSLLEAKLEASSEEIRDLINTLTGEADAEKLVEALVGSVIESLDRRATIFSQLFQGQVAELADHAVARLFILNDDQAEQVRDVLAERLSEAAGELVNRLRNKVKEIVADPPGRDALINVLNNIGETVQGALGDVDALATQLLDPVTNLLKNYRSVYDKLAAAVTSIEQERLTIAFGHSVTRTDDRHRLLAFQITNFSPSTVQLYRTMLTGDFSAALAAAADSSNEEIVLTESVFSRLVERVGNTSLSINFFGHQLSWQRILTDRIECRVQGGTIDVLIGSGTIEEEVVVLDESQSFVVDSQCDLLDGNGTVRLIGRYRDKDPSRHELLSYVSAMESSRLVSDGAAARLIASEELLQAVAANAEIRITTTLTLTRPQLERLAELPRDRIREVSILNQVTALRLSPTLARALDDLKSRFHAATAAGVIFALRDHTKDSIVAKLGGRPGAVVLDDTKARQLMMIRNSTENADALFDFLQGWRELVNEPIPRIEADGSVNHSDLRRLERMNRRIMQIIDEWVEVPGLLQKAFTDRMSPWTIALYATINELLREVDASEGQFVVPVVSWELDSQAKMLAVI